jgi:hypothetical protein
MPKPDGKNQEPILRHASALPAIVLKISAVNAPLTGTDAIHTAMPNRVKIAKIAIN